MLEYLFTFLNKVSYSHKKAIYLIVALLILIVFADSLLHLAGHFLHVLLEVVESMLEHFLEAAFGLSERQAQVVLFYGFVLMIAYLSWLTVRKAYATALHLSAVIQAYWQNIRTKTVFKTMLALGAIGATFYFLS